MFTSYALGEKAGWEYFMGEISMKKRSENSITLKGSWC